MATISLRTHVVTALVLLGAFFAHGPITTTITTFSAGDFDSPHATTTVTTTTAITAASVLFGPSASPAPSSPFSPTSNHHADNTTGMVFEQPTAAELPVEESLWTAPVHPAIIILLLACAIHCAIITMKRFACVRAVFARFFLALRSAGPAIIVAYVARGAMGDARSLVELVPTPWQHHLEPWTEYLAALLIFWQLLYQYRHLGIDGAIDTLCRDVVDSKQQFREESARHASSLAHIAALENVAERALARGAQLEIQLVSQSEAFEKKLEKQTSDSKRRLDREIEARSRMAMHPRRLDTSTQSPRNKMGTEIPNAHTLNRLLAMHLAEPAVETAGESQVVLHQHEDEEEPQTLVESLLTEDTDYSIAEEDTTLSLTKSPQKTTTSGSVVDEIPYKATSSFVHSAIAPSQAYYKEHSSDSGVEDSDHKYMIAPDNISNPDSSKPTSSSNVDSTNQTESFKEEHDSNGENCDVTADVAVDNWSYEKVSAPIASSQPEPRKLQPSSIFDSIPKKPSTSFNFSSADPSQVYRPEDDSDVGASEEDNGEEAADGEEDDSEEIVAPSTFFKPKSTQFEANGTLDTLSGFPSSSSSPRTALKDQASCEAYDIDDSDDDEEEVESEADGSEDSNRDEEEVENEADDSEDSNRDDEEAESEADDSVEAEAVDPDSEPTRIFSFHKNKPGGANDPMFDEALRGGKSARKDGDETPPQSPAVQDGASSDVDEPSEAPQGGAQDQEPLIPIKDLLPEETNQSTKIDATPLDDEHQDNMEGISADGFAYDMPLDSTVAHSEATQVIAQVQAPCIGTTYSLPSETKPSTELGATLLDGGCIAGMEGLSAGGPAYEMHQGPNDGAPEIGIEISLDEMILDDMEDQSLPADGMDVDSDATPQEPANNAQIEDQSMLDNDPGHESDLSDLDPTRNDVALGDEDMSGDAVDSGNEDFYAQSGKADSRSHSDDGKRHGLRSNGHFPPDSDEDDEMDANEDLSRMAPRQPHKLYTAAAFKPTLPGLRLSTQNDNPGIQTEPQQRSVEQQASSVNAPVFDSGAVDSALHGVNLIPEMQQTPTTAAFDLNNVDPALREMAITSAEKQHKPITSAFDSSNVDPALYEEAAIETQQQTPIASTFDSSNVDPALRETATHPTDAQHESDSDSASPSANATPQKSRKATKATMANRKVAPLKLRPVDFNKTRAEINNLNQEADDNNEAGRRKKINVNNFCFFRPHEGGRTFPCKRSFLKPGEKKCIGDPKRYNKRGVVKHSLKEKQENRYEAMEVGLCVECHYQDFEDELWDACAEEVEEDVAPTSGDSRRKRKDMSDDDDEEEEREGEDTGSSAPDATTTLPTPPPSNKTFIKKTLHRPATLPPMNRTTNPQPATFGDGICYARPHDRTTGKKHPCVRTRNSGVWKCIGDPEKCNSMGVMIGVVEGDNEESRREGRSVQVCIACQIEEEGMEYEVKKK